MSRGTKTPDPLAAVSDQIATQYSDFFNVLLDAEITEDTIRELVATQNAKFGHDRANFAELSAVAVGYRLGLMVGSRLGGAR